MQLKYGSYAHEANGAAIAITKDVVLGEGGVPQKIVERWDVTGEVTGTSASMVQSRINSLVAAYRNHGKDIALYTNTGGKSSHYMNDSDTISGTRVVRQPSFPQGDGAEYALSRTYSLAVEGEFAANYSSVLAFRESISWEGNGGADWTYLVPLDGSPIKQQLTASSVVTITQEGYAVGDLTYPTPPSPLWPNEEITKARRLRYEIPAINSRERRVSWSYTFLTTLALAGSPNLYEV